VIRRKFYSLCRPNSNLTC